MDTTAPDLGSFEQALAWERQQPERYEFLGGVIRMMTGGTADHNRIAANLRGRLNAVLESRGCEAFSENMKVVHDAGWTYPDIVATCVPVRGDTDSVDQPILIAEVLSKTTEHVDRRKKWAAYRLLPSLRYYLLISQDEIWIELFARVGDVWTYSEFSALGDRISLPELGMELALADIYRRTEPGRQAS